MIVKDASRLHIPHSVPNRSETSPSSVVGLRGALAYKAPHYVHAKHSARLMVSHFLVFMRVMMAANTSGKKLL